MKLAVEAGGWVHDSKTGVYYYSLNLVKEVLEQDKSISCDLVYFGSQGKSPALPRASVKAIHWFPRKLYSLLLRARLAPPIDLLANIRPDIFLFPRMVRWPLRKSVNSVVIVHDTAFADYPEIIETKHFQRYLSRAVPRSIKVANHIIVNSESTKRSLMGHWGVENKKITVIPPALDHSRFKPVGQAEIDRIKTNYLISKPYILYLGTLEPRKNIVGIIEAYKSLPENIRKTYQLVLAGGQGLGQ